MNRRQRSYMKMWIVIRSILADNYDLWKADIGMIKAVERFDKYYNEIEENSHIQSITITGITEQKNDMRQQLIKKLVVFASRIRSYAAVVDNMELYYKIKCTKTWLKEISVVELLSFINNTISIAEKYLDNLQDYGIDKQKINELQAMQNKFDKYSLKPRSATVVRSDSTSFIKEAIPRLAEFVRRVLDTNLMRYSESHPEFYGKYKIARRLVGNPQRKSAVIGLVSDTETNMPIKNVKIKFELIIKNATDKEFTRLVITTDKGNYRIKTLKTGRYRITIMHPEYETQIIEKPKYPRQHIRLNLQLKATGRVDGHEYSKL